MRHQDPNSQSMWGTKRHHDNTTLYSMIETPDVHKQTDKTYRFSMFCSKKSRITIMFVVTLCYDKVPAVRKLKVSLLTYFHLTVRNVAQPVGEGG